MMKTELSSLLDGELEDDRHQAVLTALQSDADLRAAWSGYQLIGDALRQEAHLELDLSARVMAELQHEPTVLSPHPRIERKEERLPAMLRYAAAVAGVGAVAWLALSAPTGVPVAGHQTPPLIAQASYALTPDTQSAVDASRLQGYLLAHQAYSPSNRFDGGAGYIRTVAALR